MLRDSIYDLLRIIRGTMKKYLFLSFYMSLLAIWMQYLIFPNQIITSAPVIFIFSLCLWLAFLGSSRFVNCLWVGLAHLCFISILFYHQFFDEALSLLVIQQQYFEGWLAFVRGFENISLSYPIMFLCFSFIVAIWFCCHFFLHPFKNMVRCFIVFPLIILFFLVRYNYEQQEFSKYEFNITAKYFGYPVAWCYELMTRADQRHLQKKLAEFDNENYFSETLNNLSLSKHIYVVQFESLDYSAMNSGAMPFLQSISPLSVIYRIKPHSKKSSANSDFQTLTLKPIYLESLGVIYQTITPDYYQQHLTLPQILQKHGYKTYFYHGNQGRFFNRRAHIEKMGFNSFYFEEDLADFYPSGEWGIEDADVIDFINHQPQNEKNFHFFITVSSHFDFKIGQTYTDYISEPESLRDLYLNSVNYVDSALKKLVDHAPQDAVFLIYSDHESQTDKDDDTTLFLIYHKNQNHSLSGNISVRDIPIIIKQLLKQTAL